MNAPSFWDKKNLLSILLLPLAWLYAKAGMYYRQLYPTVSIDIPVICIGNVTVGGAGKTPTALTIGQMLKDKNINAFFVSRGYGGERHEPLLVNPSIHTARDVGDEPLLLAKTLPTIVAKNRAKGALLAKNSGAQAIIMDDGFQNPGLKKDLSLIVIDANYKLGNGYVMPAGPLREPLSQAVKRAQGIVFVGTGHTKSHHLSIPEDLPVYHAKTTVNKNCMTMLDALKNKPVFAFCGIARPSKFFNLLDSFGMTCEEKHAFPDHHAYSAKDIAMLQSISIPLITTSKDAVRLPAALQSSLHILDISLEFENKDALDTLISTLC